jgi:hypothetical protein
MGNAFVSWVEYRGCFFLSSELGVGVVGDDDLGVLIF